MGRLKRFARDWNRLGKRNPYGAILTGSSGELSQWALDEFFETGRADAARFVAGLTRLAPAAGRDQVLDFGCGVGRVTRAFADHFQRAVGADVAPSMIARARALNESCSRCRFVVAAEDNLAQFETGTFDIVYTRLVLQHIPPAFVRVCIPELIRVLSPGGVLMFQLPDEIAPEAEDAFVDAPVVGNGLKAHIPPAVVRAYRLVKYRFIVDLPSLLLRIRRGESIPEMAMFGMRRDSVERIIAAAGGRVLAVEPDQSHGPSGSGFEYWVTK